jgi:glycyl-tRNA synthetase beta chain
MTDFLLELRSEEIPARMQDDARQSLKRLFETELAKAGLKADDIATYATPRRLALIAYGLPLETQAVSEETKGPKVGAPPQALEGFLRKTGLTQDQLVERDGVYFAVVEKPGRATKHVLLEAIPAIVDQFPWPKSMRWGKASSTTESLRWVRPLQGLVALFGDEIVPAKIGLGFHTIKTGNTVVIDMDASPTLQATAITLGHRFHHPGAITIGNAGDYEAKLRACHVIVDQEERRRIIREGAAKVAADAGLVLVQDPGLVGENAGLTEWPVPMLGRFDAAFLNVPEEVIQLTARVNQKYFVCRFPSPLQGRGAGAQREGEGESASGQTPPLPDDATRRLSLSPEGERGLANAFVCTANIAASDGGATIVAGNEKVLAARLSDAKFFWEQDLKVRLEDQAEKLSSIVFHEKLGTVADKVERVAKLARWLVETGVVGAQGSVPSGAAAPWTVPEGAAKRTVPSRGQSLTQGELADQAERAARLCKADLVTGMVGEFPELQGIMGGYYARAQGEDDAVADAIRDHYKPVGQGDDVPTAPVTVAVSLADKLDTICVFFVENMRPTGSKDPFALRRSVIGFVEQTFASGMRIQLRSAFAKAVMVYVTQIFERAGKIDEKLLDFVGAALSDGRPQIIGERLRALQAAASSVGISAKPSYSSEALQMVVHGTELITERDNGSQVILDFFADRLKVQQREAGVRHDLIDAVFALGGEDDLVRLLARVKALQGFVGTVDGANLLAGYRWGESVLKQPPPPLAGGAGPQGRVRGSTEGGSMPPKASSAEALKSLSAADAAGRSPALRAPSPAGGEGVAAALETALDTAEPLAAAAIEAEDFEAAMSALASLRAPIDAFFEGVMVNDPDPAIRAYRLGLLARFRDAVHRVADFSRIEG